MPGQVTVGCGATGQTTAGDLLPTWLYSQEVLEGEATLSYAGGTRQVGVDGAHFYGQLLGPTLVSGPDHRLCLQLRNDTQAPVTLQLPAVHVVEAPTMLPGETAITEAITPTVPSVTPWLDPAQEGQGLMGLVVVRDPALVAAVDPTEHLSLVVFAPDPAISTVTACSDCPPTPAPADLTLLVAQRVIQAYRPDPLRHGGPPNEFLTMTLPDGEMTTTGGDALWLNLFNSTDVAHTIDLGQLPVGGGGAPAGAIVLAPGEGLSLAGTPTTPGTYALRCTDCPDADLATILMEVVAPEEPTGGSGASTGTTYRGGSGTPPASSSGGSGT